MVKFYSKKKVLKKKYKNKVIPIKNLRILKFNKKKIKVFTNEKSFYYNKKLNYSFNYFIYKIFKLTIKDGKKIRSYNNFSKNLFQILKKGKIKNPLSFFQKITSNLHYGSDVKTKKVGKSIKMLPFFDYESKSLSKSVNLVIDSSTARTEKSYSLRLFNELLDVYKKKGSISLERKKEAYINFFLLRSSGRLPKWRRPKKVYKSNYVRFAQFSNSLIDSIDYTKFKYFFKYRYMLHKYKKKIRNKFNICKNFEKKY